MDEEYAQLCYSTPVHYTATMGIKIFHDTDKLPSSDFMDLLT